MNRRTLLVAPAGGILATPLDVDAQQAGKVYRVGVVVEKRRRRRH